jgi:mono/diheme cytochrome c family protein
MKFFLFILFGWVAALPLTSAEIIFSDNDALTNRAAVQTPTYLREVLPIIMGRCARCHGEPERVLPDFMDYDTAFKHRLEMKRRVWQCWNGSYYKQPMPPGNSFEERSMAAEERAIIKRWVEAGAPRGVVELTGSAQSRPERIEAGKKLFGTVCAVCHQPAGQGIPGRFPPLATSDFLNADKDRAIKVVLDGLQGDIEVNGQKFSSSMPRFPLGDDDIANVLTYVYNTMRNSGKDVTADEVKALRNQKETTARTSQAKKSTPAVAQNPFE